MRRIGVLSLVVGVFFLSGCSGRKATEPPAEPVQYNIYLNSLVTGAIYIIDADSLTVIDSIPGIGWVLGMAASPDGRWLYVQADSGFTMVGQLLKVDLSTNEVVARLSGRYQELTLLDNGNLLLRGWKFCGQGHGAELVDPHTLTSLGGFPDSLCPQSGPVGGTEVAAKTMDGTNRILRVDVLTGEVTGSYTPAISSGGGLFAYRAMLHPNGRWAIVLGRRSSMQDSWLAIGDVVSDSTLFERRLVYPLGDIAVSDDGRFAVATDPGQPGLDYRILVELYDLSKLSAIVRFGGYGTLPVQVEFLPGTDHFVVTKGTGAFMPFNTPVLLFSAETATFVDSVTIGTGSIGDLAAGVRISEPEAPAKQPH